MLTSLQVRNSSLRRKLPIFSADRKETEGFSAVRERWTVSLFVDVDPKCQKRELNSF